MARAQVVHSTDAVHVIFKGDKRNPEPSMAVIEFPGGHVEVSRCSDGTYWAHVAVIDGANIVGSRIDRANAYELNCPAVEDMPHAKAINHMAIRIANNVQREAIE
jgi:hypothetical protein